MEACYIITYRRDWRKAGRDSLHWASLSDRILLAKGTGQPEQSPDRLAPMEIIMTHPARNTDQITSHMAAARVGEFRESHQQRILACLKDSGPSGAEGISYLTDIEAYSIRKRLPELEREGFVRTTGKLLKTISGRHEREWEAV